MNDYLLEVGGLPCTCGHQMGTHDIRAMDFSELMESAAEVDCMMRDCDCADYTPTTCWRPLRGARRTGGTQ